MRLIPIYFFQLCTKVLFTRWPVRYPDRSCSQPTCSKFHGESCDHLSFFHIFAIIFCKQHLWWHILLEVWLIYLNVSCAATRWHWAGRAVLRCKQIFSKMVSFLAKIDFASKFLDSRRKKWHQFGRNKGCHKILHDISNKWAVNKTNQGTGQDI